MKMTIRHTPTDVCGQHLSHALPECLIVMQHPRILEMLGLVEPRAETHWSKEAEELRRTNGDMV